MPRIYDNIEQPLLPALQTTIKNAHKADFCIGYFNLRGWKELADYIEDWQGTEDNRCRVLVGMQKLPNDEFREAMRQDQLTRRIDQAAVVRLKKGLAEEFRKQLTIGIPTIDDEAALQQLARQLRSKKVVVKLFLRHTLHAKLYMVYLRNNPFAPLVGFMGSSNLTLSGLAGQGELNIDVTDQQSAETLRNWFEERWGDPWCLDISDELAQIIEESWAREDLIPPFHIYVKMAYHLAQEARTGLSEFKIPKQFDLLFDYQKAAVQIAAHHLNKRGGVLIGDVVGLGKTLMATALARIFEDDYGLDTLIICPRNLVSMWQDDYVERYGLRARVMSITRVLTDLVNLRRYRLVIIDESHNLRNREGKRYKAIQDYLQKNESLCIMLSATPYNKTYLDLSNQLRLFVPDDQQLSIRPEKYISEIIDAGQTWKHSPPPNTIAGFEYSSYADDWRELMRLYMVRRTRSFIKQNYAMLDAEVGRRYLVFHDGTKSFFPDRVPRTIKFTIDERDSNDQYARLYADDVVEIINSLNLPRYGLGNFIDNRKVRTATEQEILDNLSKAGNRLMGFCRTNLFKRLESSGKVFLQSVERHILRNYVYLYALENGLSVPIGTQDVAMLDPRFTDEDLFFSEEEEENSPFEETDADYDFLNTDFTVRAKEIYGLYTTQYKNRFGWLPPDLFARSLKKRLQEDCQALEKILQLCRVWYPGRDQKLAALDELLRQHTGQKVLVFSQFADTVDYLVTQLERRGFERLKGVTGDTENPTELAHRFSPRSNNRNVAYEDQLDVLIATDILSEGQNLQDCSIVVNYDLPWAIIRLIQRAGRVDRIGQLSSNIYCYSFLPAEGVERIIKLRERVRQRLTQNAEVVGTDEFFFEDDKNVNTIKDLYNERVGILDEDEDDDVDLASYAYQIWKNAIERYPDLEQIIPNLSPVSFSARQHIPNPEQPEGVLVYMRTPQGNDILAWMDKNGQSVTESQFAILNAARCAYETPALLRAANHHELVAKAVRQTMEHQKISPDGQLGSARNVRNQAYRRLNTFFSDLTPMDRRLYEQKGLPKAIEEIYHYPLRTTARDTLSRQIRSGISDEGLADLVLNLRDEDRLCIISDEEETDYEPQIICSLGLTQEGL